MAQTVAKAIGSQSLAFDFVNNGTSVNILEISYTFGTKGVYEGCKGFFDAELNWCDYPPVSEDFILVDLLERIARKNNSGVCS